MFEQELIKYEDAQAKAEPGDLFYHYEVKPWVFGPRLYKILGISLIFNLAVIAVFTQGNLLMRRGCDSPFVGRVCDVLDTVYVATAMYGTDREYIDAAYEKTELADADITYIDVSNVDPPLSYPEGYFQIANPEQFSVEQTAGAFPDQAMNNSFPGFPSNPTTSSPLINTPQVLPKPNSNPTIGNVPTDSPFTVGGNPTIGGRKGRGGRVTKPDANANTSAQPETAANDANTNTQPDLKSDAVKPVQINREVMRDLGKAIAQKVDNKEVDLSKNFSVMAEATLTPDGKMDTGIDKKTKKPKSQFIKWEGDPAMIEVVKESIEAIGDSGWLGYLKNQGVDKVSFTFTQNDQELLVVITSDQPNPERAGTISSGLNGAIQGALLGASTNLVKLGDDEKALLSNAKATANGKQVILNFSLPKAVAQEMINRNLQKAREAETGKKTNGQVQEPAVNQNTAKK